MVGVLVGAGVVPAGGMNYDDLDLPEPDSIQRLALEPGEHLLVCYEQSISAEYAHTIKVRLAKRLGIEENRLTVLGDAPRFVVVAP